jgi:hypothetical protein
MSDRTNQPWNTSAANSECTEPNTQTEVHGLELSSTQTKNLKAEIGENLSLGTRSHRKRRENVIPTKLFTKSCKRKGKISLDEQHLRPPDSRKSVGFWRLAK